jgi:hypothetical protein
MIRPRLIAFVAVLAGAAAAPAPAQAFAVTRLTLSVVADAGWARAVTLSCMPPGGAHPRPAAACATLLRADGDPGRLTPSPTACTLEYAPVTADLDGMWRGRPVSWSATAPNVCDLNRRTRHLFTF